MKKNKSKKNKFTMLILKNHYYITIENASKKTEGNGNKHMESTFNTNKFGI